MSRMLSRAIITASVGALLLGAVGCQKLRARDSLNKGVQAFKGARFSEAVEYFERAVELDPDFPEARLYLATAFMSQYIPGAESPENLEFARKAHEGFQEVLEKAPTNTVALASIASLYYHQKNFDESEKWYRKVIEADPQNKEAYYTLGVIAWARTFPRRQEARSQLGMKPEDPGPIKDAKVRTELAEANLPVVEEGIQNLQQALNIDKEYDDAMAYMNLLHREKADLEADPQAYQQNIELAENWVQKSLETKKVKAARIAAQEATGITN